MPKSLKSKYSISFELQFTQDGTAFAVKRDGVVIYSRSLGKFLLEGLVPSTPEIVEVEKIVEKEVIKLQKGYPNSIYWTNGKEFKSTAIYSFLYDASNRELAIRWVGNRDITYVYSTVPLTTFAGLLDTDSIGRFVSNKVVNKFPVEQVDSNAYSQRKLTEYVSGIEAENTTMQYVPNSQADDQNIKDRSASAINALFPNKAKFPFN